MIQCRPSPDLTLVANIRSETQLSEESFLQRLAQALSPRKQVMALQILPKVWMMKPMSNVFLLAGKEIIDNRHFMSFHHELVN